MGDETLVYKSSPNLFRRTRRNFHFERAHRFLATLLVLAASAADAELSIGPDGTVYQPPQPPADQAYAAAKLGELKSRKAIPVLIDLCEHSDPSVRIAAIEAMGQIGDPRAETTLSRIASEPLQATIKGVVPWYDAYSERFPEPITPRAAARTALRRMAESEKSHQGEAIVESPDTGSSVNGPDDFTGHRALPDLIAAVQKKNPDQESLEAAWELGRRKAKEAVPALLQLLRNDRIIFFRPYKDIAGSPQAMAAWALIEIDESSVLPAVLELVRGSADLYHRGLALVAYARMAGEDGVDVAKGAFAPSPESRYPDNRAAARLFRIHHFYKARLLHIDDVPPYSYERIEEFDRDGPFNPQVAFEAYGHLQEYAAQALAATECEEAREVLVEHMHNSHWLTPPIIDAINRIDRNTLDQWSQQLLTRNDPLWWEVGVYVRFNYFPQTAAPLALQCLKTDGYDTQFTAVRFLNVHDADRPEITEKLIERLESPSYPRSCNSRIWLIGAITRQGGDRAQEALIDFAADGKLTEETESE